MSVGRLAIVTFSLASVAVDVPSIADSVVGFDALKTYGSQFSLVKFTAEMESWREK